MPPSKKQQVGEIADYRVRSCGQEYHDQSWVEQGETEADPETVYARWLALQVKGYQEKLLGVLCEQAPAALQVYITIYYWRFLQ